MLDRLKATLEQECNLQSGPALIIGVSGGPDSVCLLDGLHRLGYHPVVAHLNHQLRDEAEADAAQVQQMARRLGSPFEIETIDVRHYAEEKRLSIEEAARILRYRFLFQQVEKYAAQAVVVAHTADDQVETVLMHLVRGAGLAGLKGMPYRWLPNAWSQSIPLVRPLLDIWRSEVMNYLESRGLHSVLDVSNLDRTYFRNRLRHELIPYLESFNPKIRQAIWRTAHLLAGDYQAMEMILDGAWERCALESGPGYLAFDTEKLLVEPEGLRRLIIRRGIEKLHPGIRDSGYEAVERALDLLSDPEKPGQVDLKAGLRLSREAGRVWLVTDSMHLPVANWPALPKDGKYPLDIPGEIHFPDGWVLKAVVIDDLQQALQQARTNQDVYSAWVSMDNLVKPLNVRVRHPGERLKPLGMGGHSIKLSDMMINAKIPRRARKTWPLVCTNSEIIWVPGLHLADAFRLHSKTRQVLYLHLWHSR